MEVKSILKYFNSPTWNLARTACEKNDATLMDQAILATSQQDDLEQLYTYSCRHAIANNSTNVLTHLIKHGVSVKKLRPMTVVGNRQTSRAILEILLAHGWDINTRDVSGLGPDAQPFMWHFVTDSDMVAWCLEHGASVYPKDQEALRDDIVTIDQRSCPQILERAAGWATIATFELLRSKGAPLGWRPLHLAVETATYWQVDRGEADRGEKEDEKEKGTKSDHAQRYVERMAMVHHLVDVVGLDVNAPDQPPGGRVPDRNGTPLCYILGSNVLDTDTRELTWFLLDRGADPVPALQVAKLTGHPRFADDVEKWTALQGGGRKCCVQ